MSNVINDQHIILLKKLLSDDKNKAIQRLQEVKIRQLQDYATIAANLRNIHKTIKDTERQIEYYISGEVTNPTTDLELIGNLPMLDTFEVVEEYSRVLIKFATNVLWYHDPRSKRRHRLGRMAVTIDPRERNINFQNLDYLIYGFTQDNPTHAPHVASDGRPCLGTARIEFDECMIQCRFYHLVVTTISFLESINIDDGAGAICDRWPYADTQPDPTDPTKAIQTIKYCPYWVGKMYCTVQPNWISVPIEEWPIISTRRARRGV